MSTTQSILSLFDLPVDDVSTAIKWDYFIRFDT